MSNIILGSMARTNHGLRAKYTSTLDPNYQTFINSLEAAMIQAVYDPNNSSDCIITMSCPLVISSDDVNAGNSFLYYDSLEGPVIKFCQIHDVSISISRASLSVTFTIDMKTHFMVSYI